MSQLVHFQLLPQSTCVQERRRQGTLPTRAANYITPPSCAFKHKSLCIGQRLGSTGFRRVSEDRKRRLVIVNVAASERIAGGASYERICDCLVYPSSEKSGRTKGLVHFLGGAFIGAAPDVIYSLLIELLAKEGYLIVATPYSLSFDHTVSAQGIHTRFNTCLRYLSATGLGSLSAEEISKLPVFSVGHSLGALMQVIIGSSCSDILPQANAIISFNNKPASDAVPFFEQMGPTMAQVAPIVESSPVTQFARSFLAESMRAVLDAPIPLPPTDRVNLQSVRQFLDQIPAVFDQVSQGVSEFVPTPEQNRENASVSYAVPNNLLLVRYVALLWALPTPETILATGLDQKLPQPVKFTSDAIDETDALEVVLRPRSEELGGKLTKVVLNGTHLTPVTLDVKWDVGREYTPADAVAQVFWSVALTDLRGLVRNISDWFDMI